MIYEESNNLFMSAELEGMIPEVEEELLEDPGAGFVICALEIDFLNKIEAFAGTVLGFSFEGDEDLLKIDLKMDTRKAYSLFKSIQTLKDNLICRALYLQLGNEEITFNKNYKFSSPKILDIDPKEKICTFAADLIKISSNKLED